MRSTIVATLLILAAMGAAFAAGKPSDQPPAKAKSAECQAILDAAGRNPDATLRAGLLYYHGKQMGKACVTVDYVRAFALLREAGDTRNYASLLRDLQQKADSGNPKATAALRKIKP